MTSKFAHDISVIFLIAVAVVILVEIEEETMLFKQVRYSIVV